MSDTIGTMAESVTSSFTDVANLVTAASYVAGSAFAAASILKFKSHKDNPTQVPIGTPIALIAVSAALLFLPSILTTAGSTMEGSGE